MKQRVAARRNDLGLVLKAAAFAAHKHRDHRRKDEDKTPYINHPIAVARLLSEEAAVRDPGILAAALLHDTIEDTVTTYNELRGQFGPRIAGIVAEVTDTKFLGKRSRKLLQVAKAGRASREAGLVKIADKICNLRDILASPPADWTPARKREYFDWAKRVVDQVRGVSPVLAERFDQVHAQRPTVQRSPRAGQVSRARVKDRARVPDHRGQSAGAPDRESLQAVARLRIE